MVCPICGSNGNCCVKRELFPRRVRKWEDLTSMERELASTKFRTKSMREGETCAVLKLIDNYKMQELKDIALRNYVALDKIIGNKSWKKTWAKQVDKTTKWSFNTFVVGIKSNKKHILCGQVDILLMIQEYI